MHIMHPGIRLAWRGILRYPTAPAYSRSIAKSCTAFQENEEQEPNAREEGHMTPTSGEHYKTPLGAKFNMNKSKMFCDQCSQFNQV
jgi:hypothetical protein